MKTPLTLATALLFLFTQPVTSGTLHLVSQLSRMIGYTIVGSGTVSKVMEGNMGDKVVRLQDGSAFKVSMLLLDPLPASDVVIFARAPSQEDINKYGGSVAKEALILYKLMFEDDVVDATPVSR